MGLSSVWLHRMNMWWWTHLHVSEVYWRKKVAFKLLLWFWYDTLSWKAEPSHRGDAPNNKARPVSLNCGPQRQILNVWWQQVTFSVAAAHWTEKKLWTNCSGPLTAPRVICTEIAFSGAFSGSALLWNKAYMSVKAHTNILSQRVQSRALPQCHFFFIS